jgi:2-polyprenyl-6-methoxyphenol hydroxylase-like FAD-dependent oxidoreductase
MKVLIIGGGIGGLTAAIALQQRGFEAHVYEAAPELQPVGKGIWVPTNAMLVLRRLGLAEAVTQRGVPLERIELHDCDDGLLRTIDLRPVRERYGHTTVSIHRAALHQALVEGVRSGTLHLGKRCVGFAEHSDGVVARFEDGTEAEGDLLIGADGIHSATRKALFPDARLRYSGQSCYRGITGIELPPSLARTVWEVWDGEQRFGFSAIAPGQVYWFAPFIAPPGGETPTDGLLEELSRQYAGFPDPIPDIIRRTPPEEIIRTDLYDLAPLRRWWRGRVVLLGDAAHAMTPNLGQGGAQAIEDALVLADQLARSGTVQEALRAYQRLRRPRVQRMVVTAWHYGRVAHIRGRLLRKLRNVAMKHTPDWLNRRQLEWLYAPTSWHGGEPPEGL